MRSLSYIKITIAKITEFLYINKYPLKYCKMICKINLKTDKMVVVECVEHSRLSTYTHQSLAARQIDKEPPKIEK
jgi:hypothetical protein